MNSSPFNRESHQRRAEALRNLDTNRRLASQAMVDSVQRLAEELPDLVKSAIDQATQKYEGGCRPDATVAVHGITEGVPYRMAAKILNPAYDDLRAAYPKWQINFVIISDERSPADDGNGTYSPYIRVYPKVNS